MTDRGKMQVIGGSDIAAVLGLSPYRSAHSLYLKLTGELQNDVPDNDVLERGRKLEPVIASIFEANHPEYEVIEHDYAAHADYEYLVGSPDRLLLGKDDREGLLDAGLEIKTADISKRDEWGSEGTDEVPVQYLCQCLWYAGLFGVEQWHLAVGFVAPNSRKIIGYREYLVEYDDMQYKRMLRVAVQFWTENVMKRQPPPITEPDAETVRYYRTKYPTHQEGSWLSATDEIETLLGQCLRQREAVKEADREFELAKTKLIALLGDCEGVKTSAGTITYRQAKPTLKTDWRAVCEALNAPPQIIGQYTDRVDGSRRFNLPNTRKQ
ncbi:MAG: YqaJ viral recombinase family protein [Planctomycetaceae bacterium]|jgi:putative phage-type endonuclease|nr:YqaJ viral recombinase family protein [Planctomycetaceae bacterium]